MTPFGSILLDQISISESWKWIGVRKVGSWEVKGVGWEVTGQVQAHISTLDRSVLIALRGREYF